MSVIAKDNYVVLEYRLWLDSGGQLRGTPEAPRGGRVLPPTLPFPPEYPLTVKEVTAAGVILDMNHPFAGHDLRYQVKVIEVRPATPEELEPLKQCQSCAEGMAWEASRQ